MRTNEKRVDMLHGSIWNKIILFALPLAASSILQQLFNSVDVAIAGRFAGTDALAAVGANSSLINMFVNLFVGLAVGSNVVIATLIGQGKEKEVTKVVHSSMYLALCSGLVIALFGIIAARELLILIGTPENVLDQAVLYLRIYFIGMPFILTYNFGAAILRSIGDTKRPMVALVVAGFVNTGLNLLLVICFSMGVAGVAIATVISNVVSSVWIIILLMHEDEMIRLNISQMRFDEKYLKKVLRVGAPAGIQGMLFSLSNVFVQTGINSFGSSAVAGSSTGLNFEFFSYYVSNAFSQSAVTFVSQNYGAGNYKRCRRVCLIALMEGVLFTELLSAIFIIWRYPLVSLYTTDAEVIKYAVWRMIRVTALEGMTCVYEVTGGTMRGMGHSTLPAMLTILGTVVFRIAWLNTVFTWDHRFTTLMLVYPASWIFNIAMMVTAYVIVMGKIKRKMG